MTQPGIETQSPEPMVPQQIDNIVWLIDFVK